jgi:21S rRNA (uridine2791-2'-O)-methyltransferase
MHRVVGRRYNLFQVHNIGFFLISNQVAVERTKPSGRVIGIDIIPAQPPKGVSTIQGNFLSKGVQEEVKRFLMDPDQGRPREEVYYSTSEQLVTTPSTEVGDFYIDTDSQTDASSGDIENQLSISTLNLNKGRGKGKGKDDVGKMVDIVLSDMCEPWEQTTGFWKRSLSGPYIRMMNTSGINFKDHAGSMVCHYFPNQYWVKI